MATDIKKPDKYVDVEGVHVFANYQDVVESLGGVTRVVVKQVARGEIASVPEAEAERLTTLGAVAKPGTVDNLQEATLDKYRAERGDQEALARVLGSGGTGGDEVAFDISTATDDALAGYIKGEKLSVKATIALAGDDPALANRVLAAESAANGGEPRAGVVKALGSDE